MTVFTTFRWTKVLDLLQLFLADQANLYKYLYIILYYITLYYIILYYIILYYIILYYIILLLLSKLLK